VAEDKKTGPTAAIVQKNKATAKEKGYNAHRPIARSQQEDSQNHQENTQDKPNGATLFHTLSFSWRKSAHTGMPLLLRGV
jgi:hypothetical protein